jgi:flagellar hook assembly protein FlgD
MIEYKLPENSVVRLEIVNIIGERVGLLIEGTQEAGTHRLQWDASELPSGVYVYRLEAIGEKNSFSKVKKMLLIK